MAKYKLNNKKKISSLYTFHLSKSFSAFLLNKVVYKIYIYSETFILFDIVQTPSNQITQPHQELISTVSFRLTLIWIEEAE